MRSLELVPFCFESKSDNCCLNFRHSFVSSFSGILPSRVKKACSVKASMSLLLMVDWIFLEISAAISNASLLFDSARAC